LTYIKCIEARHSGIPAGMTANFVVMRITEKTFDRLLIAGQVTNPHYDFNDEILPVGVAYWVKLVEMKLA
jgi:hypothetical protein